MLSSLSNSFSTLVSLHCEIETTVTESSKRVPVPEVLADAPPSALLALAPSPLVQADARPSALLALAPYPSVLAHARPSALLALAHLPLVLALPWLEP